MALPAPPEGGPSAFRRFGLPAIFVTALFIALWMRRPEEGGQDKALWTYQGATMGTTYTVKVIPKGVQAQEDDLKALIEATLKDVNAKMSTYQADSELSKLNQNPSTEPISISPALAQVTDQALKLSQHSQGAFDVTVGPLVNAWGFGPKDMGTPPTKEELEALAPRVGYQRLTLDRGAGTLKKEHPQMYVDLSAIAKGFGVDEVGRALEGQGASAYMVEIGGEVRARGQKADGSLWRIGVETPQAQKRGVQEVIALRDMSMATSGNYRNFYEKDGKRLSHTIDPRTGQPVEHRLASVSVLDKECMVADGWATTLNVLGEEEGWALALKHKLPALLIIKTPEGLFVEKSTPALEELRAQQAR
jgi:thiamine biosynthesis lipoprotein